MSVATSWMRDALWLTLLALGELALLLALVHVYRRFASIVAYLRSLIDDPNYGGKASMARLCAGLAMLGALWTTYEFVRFAFTNKDSVGMAGILAGAAATLLTSGVLGLLLRKKSDGSTETIDDARRTRERAAAAVDVSVKTGAAE